MTITEFIEPCNKDHSIKEAVITVFLAGPILKPARFEKLIENELKDQFHQFQKLSNIELQIQHNFSSSLNQITNNRDDDGGFLFLGFEKGKISRILQARNENNRNYISFHSQNYKRWSDFYKDYIKSIQAISTNHPDLFVNAISLHYVDQFNWIANDKVNLGMIFNEGKWLPEIFFESEISTYQISTKTEFNSINYSNRIEINVTDNFTKEITISHNITRVLDDLANLADLISSIDFESTLQKEHNYNKSVLKDILTDPVQKMINLL